MRPIKFRVWDGKKMNRNCQIAIDPDGKWGITGYDQVSQRPFWRVDPDAVLMQSTSLKDKNGTEIYEGDIVEMTWEGNGKERGAIQWKEKSARWVWVSVEDPEGYGLFSIDRDMREVIGNTYENPELLKVDNAI